MGLSDPHIPLRPSRENRFWPDDTEVLAILDENPVVTPQDVKEHIGGFTKGYEFKIDRLIEAITETVELAARKDARRKRVVSLWHSNPGVARLSRGPHTDIESVTLTNEQGVVTTLSENQYRVAAGQFKKIYGIEGSGVLRVTYISGYSEENRPPQFAEAILQEISLQFKNRSDPDTPAMTSVNNLSLEARHLLVPIMRKVY